MNFLQDKKKLTPPTKLNPRKSVLFHVFCSVPHAIVGQWGVIAIAPLATFILCPPSGYVYPPARPDFYAVPTNISEKTDAFHSRSSLWKTVKLGGNCNAYKNNSENNSHAAEDFDLIWSIPQTLQSQFACDQKNKLIANNFSWKYQTFIVTSNLLFLLCTNKVS